MFCRYFYSNLSELEGGVLVLKNKIKYFSILTVSVFIIAIGTYFFKFSNNFVFGGITGLAVIIARTGIMSASDFTFIVNMTLLVICYFVLGKEIAAKTAYCSILLSATLSFLERFVPMNAPFTNEPILELCFAIALPALGSAIIFNVGASGGGTDIIAMILKKYAGVTNIGKALMFTDFVIAVIGLFVFDIKTGLFSFVGLFVSSLMIDNFIENFNMSKYFNIICDYPEPICRFITNDLGRSSTILEAHGAFTQNKKYVILTALNRPQALKLRNYIKENQPDAFILISNTSEIIGKGFHCI